MTPDRCPDCGAAVGGLAGCAALFDELGLRKVSDLRYARWNRLTVDAYALQHPEDYMRSAKSFVAHLTSVAAVLERADTERVNDAIVRWLSTNPALERPTPPMARGDVTIDHVLAADDPATTVPLWAASAWAAYEELHGLAREWIGLATRAWLAVR